MISLVDTSSLITLARYYLPFDSSGKLLQAVEAELSSRNLIVVDKVLDECRYVAGGMVTKSLLCLHDTNFLKQNKQPLSSAGLVVPNPKVFLHKVNNDFCVAPLKKKLANEAEFESQKQRFLQGADAALVQHGLCLANGKESVQIITEETSSSNDNKLFKKLPVLCESVGLACYSLPHWLRSLGTISFSLEEYL